MGAETSEGNPGIDTGEPWYFGGANLMAASCKPLTHLSL
jgi:hypothetical protein